MEEEGKRKNEPTHANQGNGRSEGVVGSLRTRTAIGERLHGSDLRLELGVLPLHALHGHLDGVAEHRCLLDHEDAALRGGEQALCAHVQLSWAAHQEKPPIILVDALLLGR